MSKYLRDLVAEFKECLIIGILDFEADSTPLYDYNKHYFWVINAYKKGVNK